MNLRALPDKPLIGITGRPLIASEVFPSDAALMSGLVIDSYFQAYARRVADAGGIPVHLPREADPDDLLTLIDGLVLAGGMDVDPRLYGREPGDLVGRVDPAQDRFDIALALGAFDRRLPALGCCRGSQIINVALGGTLVEDLPAAGFPGHNRRIPPPSAARHEVAVTPGTRLHALYGPRTEVNSFHHQAVESIGAGLTVAARAPDGTIEAVEHDGAPAIGVQWHPELHEGPEPIFDWLIGSATENPRTRRKG